MALGGDVGVELVRAGAEALGVAAAVVDGPSVTHEQRAGLQQVAARRGRELVARRDADRAATDVHARALAAHGSSKARAAQHAAGAQLAERQDRRPGEEPADDRVVDAARRAPARQRPAHQRHAHLDGSRVVRGDVDGGRGAVAERDAQPAQVRRAVGFAKRERHHRANA